MGRPSTQLRGGSPGARVEWASRRRCHRATPMARSRKTMSSLPPPAKILIVEDEADLLRTLEYNFRQAGFDVHTTAHGRDAIRLVSDQSPALVLLDLMLPDIA